MRFFFVDEAPESLQGSWAPPAYLVQHLRALRMGPAESFLLLLPMGGAVLASLNGAGQIELKGLAEIPRLKLLPVILATAWPKGARADDLVVRATEAGVERILPLRCERSVAGTEPFSAHRMRRWQRLIRETCQQCGRPVAPVIEPQPVPLSRIHEEAAVARSIALVPGSWPLAMELALHTPREVMLIVGPEGGFTPGELSRFEEQGIQRAGLLPTTLRIEAAGPVAVSICQHWFTQLPSR